MKKTTMYASPRTEVTLVCLDRTFLFGSVEDGTAKVTTSADDLEDPGETTISW